MANASKAKAWLQRFSVAYTLDGNPPLKEDRVIASGNTILRGDPLVLSSGEVAEAAANSGALFGVAAAGGAAGETIPVYVARRETIFVGQVDADLSSATFPFECDIVGSGTNWLIDIGASAEDVLQVIGAVPGDDLDDTTDLPRAYFQIKRSSFDNLVAAL